MLNILKKIRDFFFPPFSKRRDGYEIVRKGLLMFRKRGLKGTYKELQWRFAKPRRLSSDVPLEDNPWYKTNRLMDEAFFDQILPLPLTAKVDIVICVGPSQTNFHACLASIERFTPRDLYDLYLVVHQNDISLLPAEISGSGAKLITHNMKLFNYARANNLVLRQSYNDVVLLNDDTEVTENWLAKLRQDSKGFALTGSHTGEQCSGNPDMWGQGEMRLTHYPINMFCAYLPLRLRKVVGLLDEEYCYYGGEDVDYSCRTLLNGFPLVVSSAYVHHKDNQSYRETKGILIKESDRILMETHRVEAPYDLSQIKPMVSVILATHNRPELLKSAIESVLRIGYDNFEFLVVDDFSDKETSQVIYDYQQKDERIISVRLPKNMGSSLARSLGLKASRGQFILFTDDDDTVLSTRVSKPLEYLIQHPWLDVVYCSYNLVSHDGSITPVLAKAFDIQSYLETDFYIGLGVLLGRKQVFMDVPFMSTYDQAVDYDWVFRLLRKGYQIDLCPEIVMNYNRTGAPKYHLSGNQSSIDVHATIHDREILLRSMERQD